MTAAVNVSVILSTYNSPQWLEKVLWGYSRQTHRELEIVIADDGSDDETRRLIEHMRRRTGLALTHVWQEDEGFRKCRILNLAIRQSRHEYLLFSDGDCIPRPDFVAVHANRARPGCYLSGTYFKLPMVTSRAIGREEILNGRCFETGWLRRHGVGFLRKTIKLSASSRTAALLNRWTTTPCNFKGANGSAWKEDVLAVNGFDERMHWGGEDREFGVRLINRGIKPVHVRYSAVVLHLDHARGYVDPARVQENRALRLHNEKHAITWTDHGIFPVSETSEP